MAVLVGAAVDAEAHSEKFVQSTPKQACAFPEITIGAAWALIGAKSKAPKTNAPPTARTSVIAPPW